MQMDGPQCLGKQQSIDLCKSKGLLQQSRNSTLDLSVSQSCTYKQRIQNNYVMTIYHHESKSSSCRVTNILSVSEYKVENKASNSKGDAKQCYDVEHYDHCQMYR